MNSRYGVHLVWMVVGALSAIAAYFHGYQDAIVDEGARYKKERKIISQQMAEYEAELQKLKK